MNINNNELYVWEIEFSDGSVITRADNEKASNTDRHINPNDPPKQAVQIRFKSISFEPVVVDIPEGAQPVCSLFNCTRDGIRYGVILKAGYRLNGIRFYLKRYIGLEDNKTELITEFDI